MLFSTIALLKVVVFLSCLSDRYRYEGDSPYPEALEIGELTLKDFPTSYVAEIDDVEGICTKDNELTDFLLLFKGDSQWLELLNIELSTFSIFLMLEINNGY